MKKWISLLLAVLLLTGFLAACSDDDESEAGEILGTITVGASPTPHAEILEAARDELLSLGYELEIVEFSDYVQPNVALDDGSLDANYFQHEPYLIDYNENNGTDLVTLDYIHYEPLGLYPGRTATVDELEDGATISVPNDGSNEGRALKLLEVQGLITLDPDAGFNATVLDITDNPKNLDIVEMEAAQLPRTLEDVDMAVINGNYAIGAGLNAETDAIAKEEKDSESATTYANVIAIRPGDEDREDLEALLQALTSDSVKTFIEEEYEGAVVTIY